jgi:hypothetical protein
MNPEDIQDDPETLVPLYGGDLAQLKVLGFERIDRQKPGVQQWSKKLQPGGWMHVERRDEMPGEYYVWYTSPSHRDFNKAWTAKSSKLIPALTRLLAIFDKPIRVEAAQVVDHLLETYDVDDPERYLSQMDALEVLLRNIFGKHYHSVEVMQDKKPSPITISGRPTMDYRRVKVRVKKPKGNFPRDVRREHVLDYLEQSLSEQGWTISTLEAFGSFRNNLLLTFWAYGFKP